MKRRLQDAFPQADPSFEHSMNLAFESIRKQPHMHSRITSRRAVLLATALLLLTTAIGFATGFFQSTFSRMQSDGFAGNPTTDYEKLDMLAETGGSRQSINFSGGVTTEVNLEQSYYNGEQLLLGWTFNGPNGVEFYEKGDIRFSEVQPTEWTEVIDGVEQTHFQGINVEQRFAPEIVGAIYDKVVQEDWAGLFWYDVWMSDGVWIPGVPDTETSWTENAIEQENTRIYSASERIWNKVGANQRYYECETPLPDAARNQQSLKIMTRLYLRPTWLCYENNTDGVQSYIGYGETEMREIYFDIPLNGEYWEKSYQREAAFPGHSASISITATPIYAQIDVTNHIPEAWEHAWENHNGGYVPPLNLEADCVFSYEVWVKKNGKIKRVLDLLDDSNGIESLTGQFVIPEGSSAIILRPVYANTGAHASEDITILLEQN